MNDQPKFNSPRTPIINTPTGLMLNIPSGAEITFNYQVEADKGYRLAMGFKAETTFNVMDSKLIRHIAENLLNREINTQRVLADRLLEMAGEIETLNRDWR